jgi:hypothetical protein
MPFGQSKIFTLTPICGVESICRASVGGANKHNLLSAPVRIVERKRAVKYLFFAADKVRQLLDYVMFIAGRLFQL